MNSKICKRLRKLAGRISVGKPSHGLFELSSKPRTTFVRNEDGSLSPLYAEHKTLAHSAETARGMYRAMKLGGTSQLLGA
jgi:hypothetical protein